MDEELKRQITEEIRSVIRSRYPFIDQNYVNIRDVYKNSYFWPELDPLREEICLCIIFGLGQAAITLTNHFFETLFKLALIVKESELQKQNSEESSPTVESFIKTIEPAFDKYNARDLGDNINRACTLGLITKEQKKELQQLREDFRNAFSHSDKQKTFGDSTIPVQAVRIEGEQLKTGSVEDSEIAKLIFAHGIFQAQRANGDAMPYFLFMDQIARQITKSLFGDQGHVVAG